jgi:hypothetical protein
MPWRSHRYTKNHRDIGALRLTVLVVSVVAVVFVWWIASANYGPSRGTVELPPLLRPMPTAPPKDAKSSPRSKTADNNGTDGSPSDAGAP